MATISVKPKNNENVDKKPRVWFACHPDDFAACFEVVCKDIFKTHDCAVYYTEDMTETIADDQKDLDLGRSNLFVVPVTNKLLTTPNRAMDEDIPYALEKHIPVLPILMEAVDDEVYSSRFGELQYLNPLSDDQTEIPYEEKLKKYLESVLISKELAERIRHAFYAYIFLSYRKVDRAYANTLMRLIHSIPDCRDFAIWFDEFLTPGESFKANIEKALDDCKLFTLLVTERLFKKNVNENGEEVDNFVIANELPMAKDKRTEKGTEIFAVEMEDAGEDAPLRLEADEYIRYDDAEFRERLLATIRKIEYDVVDTPEHAFLIGLAYLEGIDMEVDRERAVGLIESAAEADLAEAMEKLIRMYKDGIGVARDADAVQKWSKRLANHYFRRIFSKRGTLKSKKKLLELFSHYADEYFAETIKAFLVYADERLTEGVLTELYGLLMQQDICEYTLFFEACKEMPMHREHAQCALLQDILKKSANGTYPPYGPLFWYVPEYELYEPLLLTLEGMTDEPCFTKALALTRDVCWIFGRYNTAAEITDRVDGEALFETADKSQKRRLLFKKKELVGVRRGLCELFFTGDTTEKSGDNVYPRCFNIAEAKHWKEYGQGVFGRMRMAFRDNLGLYSHEMFSELGDEYIGVVAVPYDCERIETVLPQKSCKKTCGLFLFPTKETELKPLAINDHHIRHVHPPENISSVHPKYKTRLGVYLTDKGWLSFGGVLHLPMKIKEIGDNTFEWDNSLISIVIPDSLTKIGKGAFLGCHNLTSITIPDSVTEIGVGAFQYCESLTSITVPKGVKAIESDTFNGCKSLVSVTLSEGTTEIGWGAFKDCSRLPFIELPKSVTAIGSGAFKGCNSLSAITLPEGVTEIGEVAFKGCSNLIAVTFPKSVRIIRMGAFKECTNLTCITLPDHVEIIGKNVFQGCISLETIENCPPEYTAEHLGVSEDCIPDVCVSEEDTVFVVPEGTGKITEDMISPFKRRVLKEVILPDSVWSIGEKAFKDCSSITSIMLPDHVGIIGWWAFEGCSGLASITLPHNLHIIRWCAFKGCGALSSIAIPDSVTKIGESAFEDCNSLMSIVLPDGLKEINLRTFKGCSNLASVAIPNSVTALEESVFENCSSLVSVKIPENVTEIKKRVFKGCSSLMSVNIPDGVTVLEESVFENCSSLVSIRIPENVTEIERNVFRGCSSLQSVNIPDGVKKIERNTFEGCCNLTSVTIPQSVTEIESCTFKDCSSLMSITLPKGIVSIEEEMFKGCRSLVSMKGLDGVKKIEGSAFEGCSVLSSITLPDGIKAVECYAFKGCSSLTSIIIPCGVTSIDWYAFEGCCSLESVAFPDGMVRIWDGAFKDCSSLASIVVPVSVKIIDYGAFAGCTGLKEITISRRFEDDLERIFSGVDLSQVTIHWL